jgi:hypothetical protein
MKRVRIFILFFTFIRIFILMPFIGFFQNGVKNVLRPAVVGTPIKNAPLEISRGAFFMAQTL